VRVPRIPDTPERRNLERLRSIRELVFGAQDGVLTTLGITTGVGGATGDRATILLTGFVSLFVGAVSMGVGQYLGSKAEREVVEHWIDFERREMAEKPEEEFAEQLAYYRLKGFTPTEGRTIVSRLTKNPEIWLHEMVRDEFGIDPRDAEGTGIGSALAMAGSFVAGAIVPLVPHVFALAPVTALWLGLVLSAVALFAVGAVAGKLAHRNIWRKGFEIVVCGAIIFALAYVAGRYVPPLFGHNAVGGL
ncbi:MAG: VIT1/CCC1 transporter family protein, partial [Candidatus Baltobacteraceae bacterium]